VRDVRSSPRCAHELLEALGHGVEVAGELADLAAARHGCPARADRSPAASRCAACAGTEGRTEVAREHKPKRPTTRVTIASLGSTMRGSSRSTALGGCRGPRPRPAAAIGCSPPPGRAGAGPRPLESLLASCESPLCELAHRAVHLAPTHIGLAVVEDQDPHWRPGGTATRPFGGCHGVVAPLDRGRGLLQTLLQHTGRTPLPALDAGA
jgi:hypothetical protein